MRRLGALGLALMAGGALVLSALAASRDHASAEETSALDPVGRGQAVYAAQCASCHGAKLEGGAAPALSGMGFLTRYIPTTATLQILTETIHRMPKQAPGSLTDRQYADIQAFILSANGFGPKGAAPQATGPLPAPPAAVAAASSDRPNDAELVHPADGDWLTYNRDYQGSRYSPLAQITTANVSQLQPVCILQIGANGMFEASPVVYGGVGYVTTTYEVQAFDAATCQHKWTYTYTPAGVEALVTNRGVALYDGKLFRGTSDGHLLALDAASGKLLWDVHVADAQVGYSITLAPIAYQGRVYAALAGGDFGAPGHIYAFDARTGALDWTFNVVPKGNEPGAETWKTGADFGGGATWSTFTLDPANGTLFASIANPAPAYLASARPGDNLYTNSVVALDAATGKLRWYVQQRPADIHDWDTAAAPVVYENDGHRYMAVASKDGLLYLYNRDTHALIARTPITTLSNGDIPLSADKSVEVCPGVGGGAEWNGPAHDPGLNRLYVGTTDWCGAFKLGPHGYVRGLTYMEGEADMDDYSKQTGWLYALDGATGKPVWSYKASRPMVGGVTPTAGGLVFAGGGDGQFLAFDAANGRILYRFFTGGAIGGGISTYLVDGRQYVAVTSGNRGSLPFGIGGAPTVLVFALPQSSPARPPQ